MPFFALQSAISDCCWTTLILVNMSLSSQTNVICSRLSELRLVYQTGNTYVHTCIREKSLSNCNFVNIPRHLLRYFVQLLPYSIDFTVALYSPFLVLRFRGICFYFSGVACSNTCDICWSHKTSTCSMKEFDILFGHLMFM